MASLLSGSIQAGHIRIEAENYIQIHTNNCFIYSVSQLRDHKLMKEFGYNTCVEIKDFAGFYNTLTDCIIKDGYNVAQTEVNECWYQNKEVSLSNELPYTPAFIKDVEFENQKEVRAAWIISDIEEKPLILNYPDIRRFCSIIDPI